jgi:hypothetical protein
MNRECFERLSRLVIDLIHDLSNYSTRVRIIVFCVLIAKIAGEARVQNYTRDLSSMTVEISNRRYGKNDQNSYVANCCNILPGGRVVPS